VLEATPEQRTSRQEARRRCASEIVSAAGVVLKAGDCAEAGRLLDEAELIDPLYEYRPGVSYDRLRDILSRREEVQA
jgi:hypothetical protein